MARFPEYKPRAREAVTEPAARYVPPAVATSSVAEAIAAERLRVLAILECPEAAERPAAARRLALHTSMAADEATAFLASLPAEQTASDRLSAQFLDAMDGAAAHLAVAPDLAATRFGDAKAARLAEIQGTARQMRIDAGQPRPGDVVKRG